MDDKSFTVQISRRWVRIAAIVGATALIVAPLTAVATHIFNDVPNDNTFHDDIAAIADAGVTLGCNPPENDEYCPNDFVTREQMAAFMNRLGALGPGKTPVVDAAALDGMDSSEFSLVPVITRLQYDGSNGDTSISSQYEELRSVGTFTKERDDSAILLDWVGHASVNGIFCEFQLRVDGQKDTGSTSTSYEDTSGGSAVLYTDESPVGVTALFQNLSAGDHAVSIWVRGSATECALNSGDFGQTVLVEETSGSVSAGTIFSALGDSSTQGGVDN